MTALGKRDAGLAKGGGQVAREATGGRAAPSGSGWPTETITAASSRCGTSKSVATARRSQLEQG